MEWGIYPGRPESYQQPHPYREPTAVIRYADLQAIVATFKHLAATCYGKPLTCGTTLDPGPEFIPSAFKIQEHPELMRGGPHSPRGATFPFLCCYARFEADQREYAAFPEGIPAGTSLGAFVGRQAVEFCAAMGFDYLWLSNGLGFSHYPWSWVGEAFDGHAFGLVDHAAESARIASFWDDLRAGCGDLPLEARGTNFSVGLDLAADCIPHDRIHAAGRLLSPPVNPPWGSRDLGMEVTAWLTRLASHPGDSFDFRCYLNDPWFWTNPWWDYYHREPFDLYAPLTVSRLSAGGAVQTPGSVALLTIDTEQGELNPDTAIEVVPHLRHALRTLPDEPGPLVWLYPYDELKLAAEQDADGAAWAVFVDAFVRCAINQGLPLNTVVSTAAFRHMPLEVLGESIVVTPLPRFGEPHVPRLLEWLDRGGKALFYGPAMGGATEVLERLNLRAGRPLEGELRLHAHRGDAGAPLIHEPLLSAGPIREGLLEDDTNSFGTTLRATVRAGGVERAYALSRGHRLAWVRGTLPLTFPPGATVPREFTPEQSLDATVWSVHLLADLGLTVAQEVPLAAGRRAALFIKRHDNAYWLAGHKPDATVSFRLALPDGVPVLTERETVTVAGTGLYHLDRSFHRECRVFVRQAGGLVSCKVEQHPPGATCRLRVAGLEQATVTLRPPRERLGATVVEGGNAEVDEARGVVVVQGVTGALRVTW
ncbi:MAG: hypothetical protein HYU66_05860 [Armatimonadetes bacterium]|nr:hypothetical protein [Armatimonadota bacterium]